MIKLRENYSVLKTLNKALIAILLFAVPVLLEALPAEWMNLTVGGILVGVWNFVRFNFLSRAE